LLRARLASRRGGFALAVELEVEPGRTLALVGESGAGKTTLLRLLAGLDTPDEGYVEVDGAAWLDSSEGVNVPARARATGYVAQDYALFPHLTVEDNVAFGLEAQHRPAAEARTRAQAMLSQLGIAALAKRRPAELSGGQQQRAALARALVLEPRLLLLDEPLSALDLQTRRAVRDELRRLLVTLSCVTIYVTHSPAEAMALGDWIAVLEHGRIVQHGPPRELASRPASPYVAELIGVGAPAMPE